MSAENQLITPEWLTAAAHFTPMRYLGNPFAPMGRKSGFVWLDNWVERLKHAHQQWCGAMAFESKWAVAHRIAQFQVRTDAELARRYNVKYSTVANLPE